MLIRFDLLVEKHKQGESSSAWSSGIDEDPESDLQRLLGDAIADIADHEEEEARKKMAKDKAAHDCENGMAIRDAALQWMSLTEEKTDNDTDDDNHARRKKSKQGTEEAAILALTESNLERERIRVAGENERHVRELEAQRLEREADCEARRVEQQQMLAMIADLVKSLKSEGEVTKIDSYFVKKT